MSGFFTKDLAFNSGTGAFLAGAAKQGTQEIEQMAANDRQQGVLNQAALFKLDKGISDYKKDEKQRDALRDRYQTILDKVDGNREAADQVYNQVNMYKNIKPEDVNTIINDVKTQFQNKPPDPNYQSKILTNIDLQSADAYGGVQRKLQLLNPNLRGALDPGNPLAHNQSSNPQGSGQGGGSYGGSGADTNPGGQQQASTPQPTDTTTQPSTKPNITPTGTSQSAIDATNGVAPSGAPIPLDSPTPDAGTNPYNPTDTGTPQSPGQPIVNTPGGGTSAPAPNAIPAPAPSTGYSSAPTGQPNAAPSTDYTKNWGVHPPVTKINPALLPKQLGPEDFDSMAHYQQYEASRSANPMHPDYTGIRSAKGNQADIDVDKNDRETYLKGLDKRVADVATADRTIYDTSRLADMIGNGLKSNALQPNVDALNRVTQPLGLDLHAMKLANDVGNTNEVDKLIANSLFGQISQYHLGRWTNFEVDLLKKQLPSLGVDPDTNIRIALLMKAAAQRGRDMVTAENAAAHPATGMVDAKAGQQVRIKSLSANDPSVAPWLQVNTNQATPQMVQAYNQLPKGAWFEDTSRAQGHQMIQKQ